MTEQHTTSRDAHVDGLIAYLDMLIASKDANRVAAQSLVRTATIAAQLNPAPQLRVVEAGR